MKIQTAMILAAFLAVAPPVQAQRRSGPTSDRPAATSQSPQIEVVRPVIRQEAPRRPATANLPSSPILPMTNPIIPITNPVQPVVRYGGVGTPTVVFNPPPDRNPDRGDRRRRNVPVVIVVGPYYDSYVSPEYLYYPYEPPATVPGQLPGTYREPEPSVIDVPVPATHAAPAAEEPIYYPEPNIIITPPEPERILQPPPLGTTKADVVARYGQPWGTIWARGKETLYFTGLTLVLEDGKVTQIR